MKKALMLGVIAGLLAMEAAAGAAAPQWKTFGNSAWRPHQGNASQHGLVTTSVHYTLAPVFWGGIELLNGPTDPASITAAKFDFKSNVATASGGSPRLVFEFSDGGDGQLRPLSLTTAWQTLDGMAGNNWDSNGGTCGFAYATTWAGVMACHAGASITAIYAVNDSGWIVDGDADGDPPLVVTLDNLTVSSIVAAGPGKST